MILKHSIYSNYSKLIQFLKDELAMSPGSLAIAEKASEQNLGPIPRVLWQYGLITIEELDRIYDWLEAI